jgi:hypothetical protein
LIAPLIALLFRHYSGKSYALVKLLKFQENEPIQDSDNNTLHIRTILFCTTANSAANPIFKSLKLRQEEDIVLNYSNDILYHRYRHLGMNIIYTSQNPKRIPSIIRNNVDI